MATLKRADRIRAALEDEILRGVLAPRARLDEQEIGQRFGVSRTPVREALNRLASDGLIELIANRGAFVRQVSLPELIEMFEVMAELEAMAGRLAARRATPDGLRILGSALEACEAAERRGDPDDYYAQNSRFHEGIYRIAANGYLATEARRLHQRLSGYRRLQLRVPRRMQHSLAEHRQILDAIADGDDHAAADRLRRHVTIQSERFADFVAALPHEAPVLSSEP